MSNKWKYVLMAVSGSVFLSIFILAVIFKFTEPDIDGAFVGSNGFGYYDARGCVHSQSCVRTVWYEDEKGKFFGLGNYVLLPGGKRFFPNGLHCVVNLGLPDVKTIPPSEIPALEHYFEKVRSDFKTNHSNIFKYLSARHFCWPGWPKFNRTIHV